MIRAKVWTILLLLVLLPALLSLAACKKGAENNTATVDGGATAPSGPPPVIACDQPSYDFGTVGDGTEVTHTFVVKNTGQGPLKIQRAQGG